MFLLFIGKSVMLPLDKIIIMEYTIYTFINLLAGNM